MVCPSRACILGAAVLLAICASSMAQVDYGAPSPSYAGGSDSSVDDGWPTVDSGGSGSGYGSSGSNSYAGVSDSPSPSPGMHYHCMMSVSCM